MNEYETNPQRHEDSSPEEQSHRPADASHEGSSPERGTSDDTVRQAAYQPAPQSPPAQPSVAQPSVAQPSVAQPSVAQPPVAAQPPSSSQPVANEPVTGQPWSGQPQPGQPIPGQPQSGQPYPGQPQSAQPYPGQPFPGQPQSGQAWSGQPQSGQPFPGQPAAHQQPGQWLGSPWQRGGNPYADPQQTGQTQAGQPQPGQPQPGYAGYPGQPQLSGQPQFVPPAGDQQQWNGTPQAEAPIWATSVGTVEQRDPAKAGRGRKIFVAGAIAVLIALASGGVGAATVLAFDDNGSSTSVQTGSSDVTRVVDRSSLAQIVSAVKDSVVSITTESGEGSGVVLNSDGYIVTNNHVVATAQGKTVTVIFADGKKAEGTITGTDPRTDLAVVKVSGVANLKPATLGSSADMQVGDTVLALGSPLGLEGSVTEGIISAKDRTIQSSSEEEQQQQQTPQNPFGGQEQQQQQSTTGTTSMSGLLQTDAPINPGNSGGALVNTNGQVIGINSAIATSGSSSGNIGLGFAIPSDKVKSVVESLMKGEKVSHPALGVSVAEAEGGGAQVSQVTANSAAAKAGLEQGDVIKTVNGKVVNDSDDLVAIVQSGKVGDKIAITFTRNGQEQTVNATLAEAA